jgi:hypothetical protein
MTRSLFYCFGGTVGSMTGRTTCGFWPDEPDLLQWDPAKLVPVDLGKNPEAVRQGLIKPPEVQCDDYAGYNLGGGTQIGPMWPTGRINGAIWLEEVYYRSLGIVQPPWPVPGSQGRPYELQSVLYWDGPYAGRRFNGIYGELLPQQQGTRTLVALWERGGSLVPGKQRFGTFWLDLAQDVLPISSTLTEVGLGAGEPKAGALFIDSKVMGAMAVPMTKSPRWLGGAIAPRRCRV